jgi:tetratricopeptide (TPR) repeat protein
MYQKHHLALKAPQLTRSQKKNLNIEIEFFEGLIEKDYQRDDVSILRHLAEDYVRKSELDRAIDCLENGAKLIEDSSRNSVFNVADAMEMYYDLLCCHAASSNWGRDLRHTERAIEVLKKAIQLGFNDHAKLASDRDLEPLRKDPEFNRVYSMMQPQKSSTNIP